MKTLDTAKIAPNRWTVPSRSNPGHLHVVVSTPTGYSCTCDGCMFTGGCAHVAAVAAVAAAQPRAFRVDPALGLSVIMAPRRTA